MTPSSLVYPVALKIVTDLSFSSQEAISLAARLLAGRAREGATINVAHAGASEAEPPHSTRREQ